jgi:hypothetical protein
MRKSALAAMVLLQACAPHSIRPLRPYEIATAPYHSADSETLVGSLMYEGGCLLFRSEDGRRQVLPIWPTGTIFQESLLTFHRPTKSDQKVTVAQEIQLQGQAADWSSLDVGLYERFRHQCGSQQFFVSAVTPAN